MVQKTLYVVRIWPDGRPIRRGFPDRGISGGEHLHKDRHSDRIYFWCFKRIPEIHRLDQRDNRGFGHNKFVSDLNKAGTKLVHKRVLQDQIAIRLPSAVVDRVTVIRQINFNRSIKLSVIKA